MIPVKYTSSLGHAYEVTYVNSADTLKRKLPINHELLQVK